MQLSKVWFGTLYIGWSGSRNEKAQTRTQADNGHVQHSVQRSALCKTEGEVLIVPLSILDHRNEICIKQNNPTMKNKWTIWIFSFSKRDEVVVDIY